MAAKSVAGKRKMLHDVIGGHQAYIHEKIDLWRIKFRSWLRPRAVSRLRAPFGRNEILKSLSSRNNTLIVFASEALRARRKKHGVSVKQTKHFSLF